MALVSPKGRGLGNIRQRLDPRDWQFSAPPPVVATLPQSVDLRTDPATIPIRNQGPIGACTAFGSTRVAEFAYIKAGYHHAFESAELYTYFVTRSLEGTTDQDAGASVRDAFRALNQFGRCGENWWPYDPAMVTTKPPQAAYDNAQHHRMLSYYAVPQVRAQMQGCLASGWPFALGAQLFPSFESQEADTTGIIPMPGPGEQPIGGHCFVVCGFDNARQVYICANSWSTGWGNQGFFTMPYAYLEDPNLAYDMWTSRVSM